MTDTLMVLLLQSALSQVFQDWWASIEDMGTSMGDWFAQAFTLDSLSENMLDMFIAMVCFPVAIVGQMIGTPVTDAMSSC